MEPTLITAPRRVERLVTGQPTTDGAGVKLTRVLTHELQRRLDPFLMLDNFASDDPDDYIAGFPNHPHRGFETVTYMIAGRMRHRDSAGNEGLLSNGGVQWMTAGRGLIHSELPEQEAGVMEGFQLWLNLPGRDKMCPPGYRDIQSAEIPEFTTPEGVTVRVIAGRSGGVSGAMARPAQEWPTDPLYLDLQFPPGGASHSASPWRRNTTPLPTPTAAASGSAMPSWRASAWPSWTTPATACCCGVCPVTSPRGPC
jgi:quercetin 2,3-dioxygenase